MGALRAPFKVLPILALLGVLLLAAACVREKGVAQIDRRLGTDPIKGIVLTNSESASFQSWARRVPGRSKTLVHIGNHDGLGFIPKEKLDNLRSLVKNDAWEEIEKLRDVGDRGLLNSANYIRALAHIGIIDRVYWVIPYAYPEYYNAEITVRNMLANGPTRFRTPDIATMKFGKGCVSGRLFDIEVHICSVRTLPALAEPVLIDIDADFVPLFASDRNETLLRAMKELADNLKARSLRVDSMSVVRAGDSRMARAVRRYMSDELVELFAEPSHLASDTPPERWKYWDAAEGLYTAKQYRELLAFLKDPLNLYPDDQTLVAFHALVFLETGGERTAFDELAQLCVRDHDACDPLLAAAQILEDRGKKDLAVRFIDKALDVRPDWQDALLARAQVRFQRGQYRGALADYLRITERRDSLALQVRIADCYVYLNQPDDAIAHYKRGLAYGHDMMGAGELAQAFDSRQRMQDLARIKGDASLGESVRRVFGTTGPEPGR